MSQKVIIAFKDHVPDPEIDKAKEDVEKNGGQVTNDFRPLLKAFAAAIPENYLSSLQSLVGDKINYIEPDGTVTTQ